MCELGLEGYGAMEIETDELVRKFHPEVAICNPQSNVKLIMRKHYTDQEIKIAVNKLQERKMKRDLEEKRKTQYLRKSPVEDEYSPKRKHLSPIKFRFE